LAGSIATLRGRVKRLVRKELWNLRGSLGQRGKLTAEPLADLQWDMQMIHATVDGSYAVPRTALTPSARVR